MNSSYYIEEGSPFTGRKLAKCQAFLKDSGLTYDDNIQYSILLYNASGRLCATGSRDGNVLKCLAVAPDCQGEGYLNAVISRLLTNAHMSGCSHLFLFTKPQYKELFKDLGFFPILQTEDILFMENQKDGINGYLREETKNLPSTAESARIGAIVMNANPFTLGHQYLIQQAKAACDVLHVFVLSSRESDFSPEVRLDLVKKGCADMPGVYIHGGSEYLISHATFPDYFMKDKDQARTANCHLDLLLFCKYFKEAFGITDRFVGEEPYCNITRQYNEAMQKILPAHGIRVTVIPRKQFANDAISASRVRRLLKENRLEEIKNLVPETTYAYLCSVSTASSHAAL
ncbi:MAG: [citrate (pro-3S)-lyase] ligase [Lachnospiraceae bacterium]|jgi:[citrate (pro-3S)-lyase] ligase